MGFRTSTKTQTIELGNAGGGGVSSVILQIHKNGAWDGQLVLAGFLYGSGLPAVNLPYQNLVTLADVAAGTAITVDGLFAVRTDGLALQITHTYGTAGTVDIADVSLAG